MQSRDSSVWRSLAVAFGDGLAFGVGVKLSQGGASRPAKTPDAQTDSAPMPARIEQLEHRLAQLEQARAIQPAPAPFDQRILGAIVQVLDARLKQRDAAVEQRIAELETRITAEIQSLRRQDQAIVDAVEAQIEEVQDCFVSQLEQVHRQVAQNRAALLDEVGSAVHDSLEAVRVESVEKDRQIEELRQKVEDGDSAFLDLLNGLGDLLRRATGRRAADVDTPAPESSAGESAKSGRLWRVPLGKTP